MNLRSGITTQKFVRKTNTKKGHVANECTMAGSDMEKSLKSMLTSSTYDSPCVKMIDDFRSRPLDMTSGHRPSGCPLSCPALSGVYRYGYGLSYRAFDHVF